LLGCLNSEHSSTSPALTPSPKEPIPTPTTTPTPTPLPHPTPTPVPGIAPTPLVLNARIETDKASYLIGEKVKIRLTLKNSLSKDIAFQFPPEVRIEGMFGQNVYPAGPEIRLNPGEISTSEMEWDQKMDGKQALPGSYEVSLVTRVKNCSMCFFGGIKRILITYPQRALNKTLNLNLSDDGLILKKIVLTAERTEIYLTTGIPVAKENSPAPPPIPPDVLMSYELSLKVDGVSYPIKQYGYAPDGNWTIIFLTIPLPSDAKTAELKVKNQRSWEFKLNLT